MTSIPKQEPERGVDGARRIGHRQGSEARAARARRGGPGAPPRAAAAAGSARHEPRAAARTGSAAEGRAPVGGGRSTISPNACASAVDAQVDNSSKCIQVGKFGAGGAYLEGAADVFRPTLPRPPPDQNAAVVARREHPLLGGECVPGPDEDHRADGLPIAVYQPPELQQRRPLRPPAMLRLRLRLRLHDTPRPQRGRPVRFEWRVAGLLFGLPFGLLRLALRLALHLGFASIVTSPSTPPSRYIPDIRTGSVARLLNQHSGQPCARLIRLPLRLDEALEVLLRGLQHALLQLPLARRPVLLRAAVVR